MRLYQPTYKSKGKTKRVAKWWIEFRCPNGIVRKWGLRTTSRDVADIVARQIDSLNEWAKKHINPPDELVKWVRRQDDKLRDKIEKAGLLPASEISQTKPLTEHLAKFREALEKNNCDEYVQSVVRQIEKIIEACGFEFAADIDSDKINEYLTGFGKHTGAHYVTSYRRFAKWLLKKPRIITIPAIESIDFKVGSQRSFELDEWSQLLEATRNGKVLYNLTGYERYLIYTLAMETGLRRNELNSLTLASFNFNSCTVFVSGEHTKNGQDATQNITPETASLIKDLTKDKMPHVRLFKITSRSADMIQQDCKAASIEVENHKGKIKFHSLRHTTGTFLAARGVLPKDLQEILRHSKIDLTMSIYTHTLRGSAANAVNKLRGIGQEQQTKTETA